MLLTARTRRWKPWTEKGVVITGLLLLVIGLCTTDVFGQLKSLTIWHNLIIAGSLLAIGCLLGLICRIQVASGIAIAMLLLLVRTLGLAAIAALLPLLGASLVLGEKMQERTGSLGYVTSVLCGMAVMTGVTGWLLPFHVHVFLTYLILLGVTSYFGRHRIIRAFHLGRLRWSLAVSTSPVAAAFSVFIIAVAAIALLLPTVQYDDIAYHMLLPTQLLSLGRYKMDVVSQGWALAPWASDIFQGYIAILTGHLNRGAADACWFLVTLFGLWQLGRIIGLRAGLRWLALAAYASIPLVAYLNASMQAENAVAAATVALVVIAAKGLRYNKDSTILPFVVVSGLLVALKATQALLVLPFALVLLVRYAPMRFAKLVIPKLPLGLLVCGSSYFYAWYITGNPVFPIFNGFFKSPFGPPTNFIDARWNQGLHWDTIWQITFHTGKFQEVYPGALGFTLLALSGCVLISIFRPRLRWVSLPLLFCMLGMFLGTQYVRYILPAVAPLIPVALIVWQEMDFRKIGNFVLAGLISLNTIFVPSCNYLFNDDIVWRVLGATNGAQDDAQMEIEKRIAPELPVQRYLQSRYGQNYFVYLADPTRPFLGPFQGRAVISNWYDPSFRNAAAKADEDASGTGWIELFARTGIDHVVIGGTTSQPLRNALLRLNAGKEYEAGQAELWRLCEEHCNADSFPLLEARDIGGKMKRQIIYQ